MRSCLSATTAISAHDFGGHDSAGGVVGVADEEGLGFGGDSRFNRFGRYLKIISST